MGCALPRYSSRIFLASSIHSSDRKGYFATSRSLVVSGSPRHRRRRSGPLPPVSDRHDNSAYHHRRKRGREPMAKGEDTTAAAAGPPLDFEPPPVAGAPGPDLARTDAYLRLLLILLVSAAFFEGYDGAIIALLLPRVQATFHVSEALLGLTRGFGVAGAFCAFFLARRSDRVGRRPILLWSVAGYTLFTAMTALSWNIWSFALFQFLANVFLGAEYAVGITMIVEEFPADRRGRALGTLLTCGALGTIAVAILLLVKLQETALDWRAFYLVGLVPLVLLAFFRPRLKETRRFVEEKQR